ncbi:MAG: hypothetical protein RR585_01475 [Coprobacillus sp.]
MFEKTIELNNKDFVVKLTRKARVEIERIQKERNIKLANDQDAIEVINALDEMSIAEEEMKAIENIEDSNEKSKKLMEYTKKYLPITLKMQASDVMDEPIDPFELVYLLIKSNPNNGELSKNDYEIGMFKLEEKMGLVELEKMLKEMSDKVFIGMGAISKALNPQKKGKQKKTEEKVN